MKGILIATLVVALWATHLLYCLLIVEVDFLSFQLYLHVLIQAYLYTGLFITAHDSMHRSISQHRALNKAYGQLSLWLFAAFRYEPMFVNHMAHHRWPATEKDPDFSVSHQGFFSWFIRFFFRYVRVSQIITMAILFNILLSVFKIALSNILVFWVVPAFLSTFQLFYFGTYLPHRYPHTEEMAPHNARTLKENHLLAMLSCWFFSYHWEHHDSPRTPWWRMYTLKRKTD